MTIENAQYALKAIKDLWTELRKSDIGCYSLMSDGDYLSVAVDYKWLAEQDVIKNNEWNISQSMGKLHLTIKTDGFKFSTVMTEEEFLKFLAIARGENTKTETEAEISQEDEIKKEMKLSEWAKSA